MRATIRSTMAQRALLALLAGGLLSCGHAHHATAAASAAAPDQGWRSLFDGQSVNAWRGYKSDTIPSGWQVVDGALTRVGGGGDIVTRETFGNFELTLEWKVDAGGNSGIFYRASEDDEAIYWTAPEMQVLDDAGHRDGQSRLTAAGSLYGLYPAVAGVVKPAGEWNTVRLVVNGTHVEHWLNGVKLVDCELGSPDWTTRVAASKFAPHLRFGRNVRGHIGLQDHGDRVAYRNIRIRELP
jgi:3-keto-disaccharide hydrolase